MNLNRSLGKLTLIISVHVRRLSVVSWDMPMLHRSHKVLSEDTISASVDRMVVALLEGSQSVLAGVSTQLVLLLLDNALVGAVFFVMAHMFHLLKPVKRSLSL